MMDYELRARSERRARLFTGGTYFRAKKAGLEGNKISVMLLEMGNHAKLVVMNNNQSKDCVKGPVNVDLIECHLDWNEGITIDALDTTPTARGYSISWQIAGGKFEHTLYGAFPFNRVFRIPGKLVVKLSPKPSEFDASRVVFITPRCQVYELQRSGDDGWDTTALRQAIINDPWIEMPERGTDVQDEGEDAPHLTAFAEMCLRGGDNLPATPVGHEVGPGNYMVLHLESEAEDGELVPVNRVLRWNGQGWE